MPILLGWLAATVSAAELVSPVAVPYASGPAFPQNRDNRQTPDPRYAAQKAIDGDPTTFCCLLDDTLGGSADTTIPARAKAPVTGHLVFDLGKPMTVFGAKITGRADAGGMNPKSVDFFCFTDDSPAAHPTVDDLEHDKGLRPLGARRTLPRLTPGGTEDVLWDGVRARYVGLRVNEGYECGPVHYNFQIAEIEFYVGSQPDPQELHAAETALRRRQVASLRLAIEDLARTFPDRYPGQRLAKKLDELEAQLPAGWPRQSSANDSATSIKADRKDAGVAQQQEVQPHGAPLVATPSGESSGKPQASGQSPGGRTSGPPKVSSPPFDQQAWLKQLQSLQREALVVANPLLEPGKLLFVKRYTYKPGWYYAEFMRASQFGGGLYVLSLADNKATRLAEQLDGGIVDRFDLSFDGRRVVFAYKAAPGKGFRLWEVGADNTGLRQLTFDPADEPERIAKYWHPAYKPSGVYRHHTDDFHPCYLPDGGIALASTRCERGVLCDQSDSLAVNVLYRMNADGSGLRMLSRNALSESTPSVANDGRILYTRWEYVDKGVIALQALWTMRPDGSGAGEIYGNDVELPPVLIHGRAVPGMDHLFVATATMHHPFAVGPILLIDARRDVRTLEPIRSLTPDTDLSVVGKDGRPHAEHYAHLRGGRWVNDDRGPLFAEPYPLGDPATGAGAGKYFLVTCNPDRPWHDAAAYGLWLIDVFGNRVLIYADPKISCWQPVPLRARPRPPVIPSHLAADHGAALGDQRATVVLHDVYAGLDGVPRGTIKYLRILEQVARPWAARRFWPNDSALGQHAVISMNAHIHVKIQHGIVPVEEDGSAHFTVPVDKNLFFQALDRDFLEVQRMRTFVNFQAGEVRSCVGCHQYRRQAPPQHAAMPMALRRSPSAPGPQPGETVPRPIHYPTDVEPILARHCTQCHSGRRLDGGLDLSGQMTEYFSRSYESLMSRKLVAAVQEFYGPQPDAQVTNVEPLPPKTVGSHASRLISILRAGHYDVKLSPEEMIRLATWVDANGPYYGTYYGPRNWRYKDRDDFRPIPTLESASGIPPAGR